MSEVCLFYSWCLLLYRLDSSWLAVQQSKLVLNLKVLLVLLVLLVPLVPLVLLDLKVLLVLRDLLDLPALSRSIRRQAWVLRFPLLDKRL
jgi:hypothetical protein